jgi:hypothetical protein
MKLARIDGHCATCLAALERALRKMESLDKIMKDYGLEYSVKVTIRQRHTFIGLIFDALRGRLLIAMEKRRR